MKRTLVAAAGLMASGVAFADNLQGIDRLLCAVGQVVACVEEADCYPIPPSEVDVPEFVIVDVKGKVLSTTKASERNRRTPVQTVQRADGFIYLQGIDLGRAFSLVIDEATGHVTVAVSRDGVSVTVFGVCTSAAVE